MYQHWCKDEKLRLKIMILEQEERAARKQTRKILLFPRIHQIKLDKFSWTFSSSFTSLASFCCLVVSVVPSKLDKSFISIVSKKFFSKNPFEIRRMCSLYFSEKRHKNRWGKKQQQQQNPFFQRHCLSKNAYNKKKS